MMGMIEKYKTWLAGNTPTRIQKSKGLLLSDSKALADDALAMMEWFLRHVTDEEARQLQAAGKVRRLYSAKARGGYLDALKHYKRFNETV
jgi:hypothetical protein